jgi:hypothetical protein
MEFCLLIELKKTNNSNQTIVAKNQKYEHNGRLKFKIHILFNGDNSWTGEPG